VQNAANIALDLLFVPVLGWKVAGVAAATVIADYLALAVGASVAWRALGASRSGWSVALIREPESLRRLFTLNGHLLVRTIVLMSAFGFMTAIGARQGDVILAANAMLIQMLFMLAYALDGFANAAEALVGRAFGAGDAPGVRLAVRRCMQWTAGVALGITLAYFLFGDALLALLTGLPAVLAAAHEYLPWLVVAPLVCAWAYVYDGIFVGATLSRPMRDTMLMAAVVFLLAWWTLRPLGNHGLWAAFLAFNAARGFAQRWVWRRATDSARPASAY
jgi:MATE family multidrug resistance protein